MTALQLKIAPSILSADFWRLGEEVSRIEEAGADWVHVDVMDGHFVPNISIGTPVVSSLKKHTHLPLDVHLMISEPDRYLEPFIDAGADILSVHVETCPHLQRTLATIRSRGAKAGVVLNPATSLTTLDHVLREVDLVLLMTVNPGFGGQEFLPSSLPKIQDLRRRCEELGLALDIEVDGGITPGVAEEVVRAGANVLVAGSSVFHGGHYEETLARLRAASRYLP